MRKNSTFSIYFYRNFDVFKIIYKKSIEVFPNVFIFLRFCNERLKYRGKGG